MTRKLGDSFKDSPSLTSWPTSTIGASRFFDKRLNTHPKNLREAGQLVWP